MMKTSIKRLCDSRRSEPGSLTWLSLPVRQVLLQLHLGSRKERSLMKKNHRRFNPRGRSPPLMSLSKERKRANLVIGSLLMTVVKRSRIRRLRTRSSSLNPYSSRSRASHKGFKWLRRTRQSSWVSWTSSSTPSRPSPSRSLHSFKSKSSSRITSHSTPSWSLSRISCSPTAHS